MQPRKPWSREGEQLARRSHSEAAAGLGPEPSRAIPLSTPVALEPPEQKNIPLGHRPCCQGFQRSATRRVPAPVASPQSLGMAGGPGPPSKPAAGAGDTSSPSQRAWASGATPEIAQLSSPQRRSGCSLPVQMGHLAGQEALHPLRCLHLLPHLRSRGKSQLRDFVQSWICCVILGESLALSGPQLSHLENAESAWACPGRL